MHTVNIKFQITFSEKAGLIVYAYFSNAKGKKRALFFVSQKILKLQNISAQAITNQPLHAKMLILLRVLERCNKNGFLT